VFEYFPGNYTWSAAFTLALMAGGQLNQMDRWLAPIRDLGVDPEAWTHAWDAMAQEQEELGLDELASGFLQAASARDIRAAIYYLTGERQAPLGPAKTRSYEQALAAFRRGVDLMAFPLERVEVPSPDGFLPGYIIPSALEEPSPVVIFYNGFDVTKEILFGIIQYEFARRGLSCLVIDTPGTGEPLRFRGVPSRPDYEVPTSAIVDYLETRSDIDKDRIGLLGISLGGYYAPRGAAYEHRVKACAAWCGVWDYGATWQRRWDTQTKLIPTPYWQLPWVLGTATMEEALLWVKEWTLADAMPHLTQPLLIVHGENDSGFTVDDARRAFEAANSEDKTLRIFSAATGGAEHVNADDPDPARQIIADWFADRLDSLPNPR
jgi:dienelactone hydrolase